MFLASVGAPERYVEALSGYAKKRTKIFLIVLNVNILMYIFTFIFVHTCFIYIFHGLDPENICFYKQFYCLIGN